MIEEGKDSSICCNYCGWKIPNDVIRKISENVESLFCEFCGTQIKLNINTNRRKYDKENLKDTNISNSSGNSKIKKSQKTSVSLILRDEYFPRIFKKNLIIVMSRLIYTYIREWARDPKTSANREIITKSSIYNLACKIKPIIDNKISNNFLGNLHHITIEEFEDLFRILQNKLRTDELYLKHFKYFLLWLIKTVVKIKLEMWERKNIPPFHSTILKDLKEYNFDFSCITLEKNEFKRKIIGELDELSEKYENSAILNSISKKILADVFSPPKKLKKNDLPSGFRSNPKYLASVLIYYGLRHEDYNSQNPEFRLYGVGDYIRNNYTNNSTMKRAMTTLPSKVYDFLSEGMKCKILYFPKGRKETNELIKKKVKDIKSMGKNKEFFDNLKKSIRKYCKNLDDPEILYNLALDILRDSIQPPKKLNYLELLENVRYSLPKYYAVSFIFLAINHKSYKDITINITAFSNNYFKDFKKSNYSIISKLYNYLSQQIRNKINYSPKERFDSDKEFNENLVWEHFSEYLIIFDSSIHKDLLKNAKELYGIAKLNGFNPKLLSSKNPKYLAFTLVFFSLLNSDYEQITKDQLFKKFRENHFEISHTIANKNINIFHFFVKDSLIRSPRMVTDEYFFKDKLERLKRNSIKEKRFDNEVFYDLILNTLKLYKNNFEKFVSDLTFISSQGIKRTLERLSNPNVFDKELYLMKFLKDYKDLIKNLKLKSKEKENLLALLKKFEQRRKKYYKYEENKTEKKEREKERYLKYGDFFYSHKIRVERFLLMLGFSPYDGFDLWKNKIYINGKHRIYANFHHFRYNPEEQSKGDLVFIPIKPPKKVRTGDYLSRSYLTHNMISGLEGNLKRCDISEETRSKILKKLQKIEQTIEYNSLILEKAIFTQNHKVLYDLKNWAEGDINNAINRLEDTKFTWARKLEKYLPTANGYENERINAKEKDVIIKRIRKRII